MPVPDTPSAVARTHHRSPDRADLERFVRLSMPLTGFAAYDLYGTGMAGLYLDTARTQLGAGGLEGFLDAWQEALDAGLGPDSLSDLQREIARALVYLWYTGAWPRLAPAAHAALRRQMANTEFVVSAETYPEGLVWRSFGGHPAGAKPPGFATWSDPPPGLPDQDEIREELAAAGADSPLTAHAVYADAAYAEPLPEESVPDHLLPGPRLWHHTVPSAVPAVAPPPRTAPNPSMAGE
ncbi:hypothetical protein [Streptomyces sp. NPDC046727]|uniref:hypothetical protein n=1 Tax=Streptomyces sp. NPDC046727 TaxID=3155373 RepID=UPI0033E6A8B9